MNGWLAKKSDNWLIQLAIVCKAQSACGGLGACPHRKFANLAYSVLNLAIFLTEK